MPVDGGVGRACRGSSPGDNAASYYEVMSGMPDLESCKQLCVTTAGCRGIEYNVGGRCEVWTREDGIRASIALEHYTCLRFGDLPTTTTAAPLSGFQPVDGGVDRACRGDFPGDNAASYYQVVGNLASLQACQEQCVATEGCTGIEYHVGGRCEVWTRPEGIHASIVLEKYTCLSYGTGPLGIFEGVDGGSGRVCRGAHPNDNAASYFTVAQASSLEGCKALCTRAADCQGIEYHVAGRCELWTRPDGIQASREASDYTCLRFLGPAE